MTSNGVSGSGTLAARQLQPSNKQGQSHSHQTIKPLQNRRFYLDIKSHLASKSLEDRLRNFGATVEVFLVKEVNCVVTDRPQWSGTPLSGSGSTPKCLAQPSPSLAPFGPCSNESPVALDSPGDGLGGGGKCRTKSRAEAMLERARLQPQQNTVDPLENASRWKIPVWPLEKVHKWLDKITEKLNKYNKSQGTGSKGLISLKEPFIKLESFSRQHRPAYKEFSTWPIINLDVEISGCPFQSPKDTKRRKSKEPNQGQSKKNKNGTAATINSVDNSRMTRNAHGRVQPAHEGAFPVPGYCEICQINYVDQKQHIQSEQHLEFVGNSNNYLTLDTLINKGPAMDTFLKLNGANQISPVTLSGNTRRSLRSVVKLVNSAKAAEQALVKKLTPASNGHHFTRSSSQRQSEEKSKMLLQHKETLEVQCNGIWSHCYETRHGGMKSPISGNLARRDSWEMRTGASGGRPQRIRRASASYCSTSLPLHQQLSPTGSDSGHHLRSRGQLWLPSNLLGTTAEDEGYPARSRAVHVSSEPQPARISRDVPGLRSGEDKVSHLSGNIKDEVKTSGRFCGNHSISSTKDDTKGCTNKISASATKDEAKHASGRNSNCHGMLTVKDETKNDRGSSSNSHIVLKEDSRTVVIKSGNLNCREEIKSAVNKNSTNTSSSESKNSNHKGNVSNAIRRKRLSVEEKLIEDNKAYYKLELKNSKLRSSGYFPSQREVEIFSKVGIKEEKDKEEVQQPEKEVSSGGKCNGVQASNGPKKEKPQGEAVVIRRVRKSELTLLSDEAESFMFGEPTRREITSDSSSDEEVDMGSKGNRCVKKEMEENTEVKKNGKKSESNTVTQIKQEPGSKERSTVLHCDESSIDSCSMASSCDTNPAQPKRKRRTHAEAFIHDNLDYYKFEIPGSRLRFQGSILPHTFSHVEDRSSANKNSKGNSALSSSRKGNKGKHPKKTITLDKPNIKVHMHENHKDKTEEDNKVKLKQEDINDEIKEKINDVGDPLLSSMDKLKFSFEAVPHTEPWYQTYLRQDEGDEFYSYACMSDACYWKSFLLPYELPSSEGSGLGMGNAGSGSSSAVKKRRNKYAHLLDKKPRKSPRCHASTLAILSSLMNYRRRREPDKVKEDLQKTPTSNSTEEERSPENVSTESPTSTSVANPTTAEQKMVPDADLHEMARTIDRMLSLSADSEEMSGSDNEISGDDVKQEPREMSSSLKASECKSPKAHSTIDRKRNFLKHENKKLIASRTKKVELEVKRHKEMLEIDPAVMEELSSLPPSPSAEKGSKCRGGPKIDVVTLLNGFSTCHCLEESHYNKESIMHPTNSHLILGESSCNSSECGASSTCETVTFSDGPEGRMGFLRGKKRKRKKNRTGWPVEKQKTKKKLIEKFGKGRGNINKIAAKAINISRKLNLSVENNLLLGGNSAVSAVRLNVKESRASPDLSTKTGEVNDTVLKSEQPLSEIRRSAAYTRTESIELAGPSSLEYQPCVRVTKISNIAEAVASAGSSFSSSRDGVSNSRRLRSASLSSSSPSSSVSVQKKCFPLSSEGSSPLRRRGRPFREFSPPSSRWSTWSARKRR